MESHKNDDNKGESIKVIWRKSSLAKGKRLYA